MTLCTSVKSFPKILWRIVNFIGLDVPPFSEDTKYQFVQTFWKPFLMDNLKSIFLVYIILLHLFNSVHIKAWIHVLLSCYTLIPSKQMHASCQNIANISKHTYKMIKILFMTIYFQLFLQHLTLTLQKFMQSLGLVWWHRLTGVQHNKITSCHDVSENSPSFYEDACHQLGGYKKSINALIFKIFCS